MKEQFFKKSIPLAIAFLLIIQTAYSQSQTPVDSTNTAVDSLALANDTLGVPSETMEFSLDQALAYATEFGYQSMNANIEITKAEKKVREVLGTGLPQVNVNGNFSKNLALQENVLAITDPDSGEEMIQKITFGTDYSSMIGGRIDQLLFDGSFFVGLKASKVYVQLSENTKDKTDIEVRKAVSEAYFLVTVAQKNVIDFKLNLETNEKTLKDTKALYENGFREDIDVDQIRLLVNESNQLFLEAQRQLHVTEVVLKYAMGFDIDKPLKISSTMEDLLSPIPLEPGNSFDYATHIDYQTMNTQVDIQNLIIKNQKALFMPKLNAFYNYDLYYLGYELNDLIPTSGSAIGLTLSIPILSGGTRAAQLKQEKLELSKLNNDRLQLEQNLKSGYYISKNNLVNSRMQYINSRDAREIALRIYQKSLIKFQNGLLNSLELTQTENKLVQAHINYRQTAVEYYNNYLAYQQATNQL